MSPLPWHGYHSQILEPFHPLTHTKCFFFLNEVCTPEDDTVNVETCRDNGEFKLISRTFVVTDCTVLINRNVQDNIFGKSVRDFNHSLSSGHNNTVKTFSPWLSLVKRGRFCAERGTSIIFYQTWITNVKS
jgi:hypothetical protein